MHNSHLVQALLLDLLGETPLPLPATVSSASGLPSASAAAQVALGPVLPGEWDEHHLSLLISW